MSISIRKKYIKYNNERYLRAQSKEPNYHLEKSYKTSTYINPKFKIKGKQIELIANLPKDSPKKFHINNNLRNNTKGNRLMNKINTENNKYDNNTNYNYRVIRRNYSHNYIKKKDLNDVNDIISIMLEHEVEKIKINLLKYIIDNQDINIILRMFSEIIEDLINEYNINNNCILDNESNRTIIDNKYQIIKENIMQEYFKINNEIYSKYFSVNKKENLDKLKPISNFMKHCTKCNEIAMHKTRNPLFLIPNTDYVICKETYDIYNKNNFECLCEFDGDIYISSFLISNYKNNIIALQHRNNLEDEKCLCLKCRHMLYYNTRNKKIKCFKCNIEEIDDYNSIFYNEIFFSKLKDEINFSLVMKRKSNPCKYCTCGGILYQGKFLGKYILVCSRCQKCQYDIRNGRYKYKLYLFQKKKKIKENNNKQDINIIKPNKSIYKNKNLELKLPLEYDSNKENNFYNNIKKKNNEINSENNEISIIPKIITNITNFTRNKNNRNIKNNEYIDNSNNLIEEKKDNKGYSYKNDSKDLIKIKRELVIKTAKLLLLNNSTNENNRNINNLLFNSNNKTIVTSRKIRVLNGYNFNLEENESNHIKKRKINLLLRNTLDENYNKIIEDKIDIKVVHNKEIIKKTLTNNNSYNHININININTIKNINIKNNISPSKNNITNKIKNTTKIIGVKKEILPSDLNTQEYKIISIISSSSFSTVYKVENIYSKKNFAIKKIIFSSKSNLENWKKEQIELFQILNHSYFFESINIIPVIQYNIKQLDHMSYVVYLLMPLANIDLNKKILSSKQILSQDKLIKILKQLIKTLTYLQKIGICHRDIKPGNIFEINDNYYLGDFDQSIKINLNSKDKEEEIKGTEAFISPLLFNALIRNHKKVKHNLFKSDVYSLGLCFVYALTKNLYILQKIREIKQSDKIKIFIMENLLDKKIELSKLFLDVITKMLVFEEKNRPDFIELNKLIN